MAELQDFCKIVQGGRHKKSGKHFVERGYPAYGAGGMNGFLPEFEFAQPGIVLSSIGARCGKCFLPDDGPWSSLANTQVIFPDPKEANIRFIWYQLNDETSWVRRGTGQPYIRPADVKTRQVYFPALSEQEHIVAILDKAEAIRRKHERIAVQGDEFLKSVYLQVLGHLNPDYTDWPTYTVKQLADKCKGSIRSGPFGSTLRHSEFVDKGIAVLGIDNAVQNRFTWGERRFITAEKYEGLRRYRVFPNDVIVTIMGTPGRSAVVPEDIPTTISTKHLATITCNLNLVHPEVLSFAIHSDPIVIRQINKQKKGAIMSGLSLGIIRKLGIKLAPVKEQKRFVAILLKTREMVSRLTNPISDGSVLSKSLSQSGFRGEI